VRKTVDKNIQQETKKMANIEAQLKQIAADNYSKCINLIEKKLSDFKTSTIRLKLLEQKSDLQQEYLRTFK
jgi:hypothetical protein